MSEGAVEERKRTNWRHQQRAVGVAVKRAVEAIALLSLAALVKIFGGSEFRGKNMRDRVSCWQMIQNKNAGCSLHIPMIKERGVGQPGGE